MIYLLLVLLTCTSFNPSDRIDQKESLRLINDLRVNGCQCGSTYMPPVSPVNWNELLEKAAYKHARDMSKSKFFDHISKTGKDIGIRLDEIGYVWQFAGENIGQGQRNLKEAFVDWKKSPSHCKMMMNPKVDEMGIAKFKQYWVQDFGKKAE